MLPAQAGADQEVPGCIDQPWMLGLRAATRVICDSPLNPDGSWERRRGFFAPAYTRTTCGTYSCTSYTVPELRDVEEYRVTPDTVLPDEPGWIP